METRYGLLINSNFSSYFPNGVLFGYNLGSDNFRKSISFWKEEENAPDSQFNYSYTNFGTLYDLGVTPSLQSVSSDTKIIIKATINGTDYTLNCNCYGKGYQIKNNGLAGRKIAVSTPTGIDSSKLDNYFTDISLVDSSGNTIISGLSKSDYTSLYGSSLSYDGLSSSYSFSELLAEPTIGTKSTDYWGYSHSSYSGCSLYPTGATFSIDTSNATKQFYWTDSVKTISTAGVTGKFRWNGETKTIANSSLDFEVPTPTQAQLASTTNIEYSVTVYGYLYTDEGTYITSGSSSYSVYGQKASESLTSSTTTITNSSWYGLGSDVWAIPSNITFTYTSNGSSTTLSASQVSYYYSSNGSNKTLNVGDTMPADLKTVYAKYGSATCQLSVSYNKDSIASYEIVSKPSTVVLGYRISHYKSSFSFKITYNSGSVEIPDNDNWDFLEDDILESEPTQVKIQYNASGTTFIFDSSNGFSGITFANPVFNSIAISDYGSLKTTINNGQNALNFSNTKLTVTYKESSFSDNLVEYTEELSYSSSLSAGYFKVESDDSKLNNWDFGSDTILEYETIPSSGQIELTITALDEMTSTTSTIDLTINICEMTKINGISSGTTINIEHASVLRTEYYVGEAFLSGDRDYDWSNVKVSYEDFNGNMLNKDFFLADKSSFLNVYPVAGTIFSSIGMKTVYVRSAFDANIYFQYDIEVKSNIDLAGATEEIKLVPLKLSGSMAYMPSGYGKSLTLAKNTYILVKSIYTERGDNGTKLLDICTLASDEDKEESQNNVYVYGYLNDIGDLGTSSSVILFHDYNPPVAGESNITVNFPCYDSNSSSFIDNCTFGIRFGHNNALNKLFLSGNKNNPNEDIFSEEPNEVYEDDEDVHDTEGDFSYFSDEHIFKYGEADNSIVGYDVISDSQMLVLKNRCGKEGTVYFRTPTSTNVYGLDGNIKTDSMGNTVQSDNYSRLQSNSPTAGVSPKSIANFNGDTLFVDADNHIAGLDITGIVGNSQRQANTRSYYIDPTLKDMDLSKALLFAHNDYCFLDCGDACFVSYYDSKSDSQYEWWPIDGMNANCFFEDGNDMYFGTEDGKLFILEDSDDCEDADRIFLGSIYGNTLLGNDSKKIVIPQTIADQLDTTENTWYFKPIKGMNNESIYRYVCDVCHDDGSGLAGMEPIKIGDVVYLRVVDSSDYINDGTEYYIAPATASAQASSLSETLQNLNDDATPLKLVEMDFGPEYPGEYIYKLVKEEDGSIVSMTETDAFSLAVRLDKELIVKENTEDGDEESAELYLYDGNQEVRLSQVGTQNPTYFYGELTKYSPIKAQLWTGPVFASSMAYEKNILKLDLMNSASKASELYMGLISNKSVSWSKNHGVSAAAMGFDLKSLDFANMDLSKSIGPRVYTIRRFARRQKYFTLVFASNTKANSILPSLVITYMYRGLSKGSD